jgi:hypothetical protein
MTPSGSNDPSGKNPRPIIPTTGSTKKTPSTRRGSAAKATSPAPDRPLIDMVIRW